VHLKKAKSRRAIPIAYVNALFEKSVPEWKIPKMYWSLHDWGTVSRKIMLTTQKNSFLSCTRAANMNLQTILFVIFVFHKDMRKGDGASYEAKLAFSEQTAAEAVLDRFPGYTIGKLKKIISGDNLVYLFWLDHERECQQTAVIRFPRRDPATRPIQHEPYRQAWVCGKWRELGIFDNSFNRTKKN